MDADPIDILNADFIVDTNEIHYGKKTMDTPVYPGMLIIVDGVAYKAANDRVGCSACCFDVRTPPQCKLFGSKPFDCFDVPKPAYSFSPLPIVDTDTKSS